MFDEIEFDRIKRLPKYVFAAVNELKMAERRAGEDVIDFSMGNPDGPTPQHIVDKLVESINKPRTHGYSVSKGIYKLRGAVGNWYQRKYNVDLDLDREVVVTMGSKEGYVHLVQAITNLEIWPWCLIPVIRFILRLSFLPAAMFTACALN